MEGYAPEAREALQKWGAQRDANFRGVTCLVRSKILVMVLSVAALTLNRRLFGTTDRQVFVERLEAELRRSATGPGSR